MALRSLLARLAPPPAKSSDGRDQWPSRAAFLLAAMGGCAGMGNLLRYPSQVFNNHGLQWFLPYLLCVFLIAVPVLALEVAVGQARRGGSVVAFSSLSHRLAGLGLAMLYVAFVVSPYFVVNLAWVMVYFRSSFVSPLPWDAGRGADFFERRVVANVAPVPGNLTAAAAAVADYTRYPGVALVGETVAWAAFTWFIVWLSIFRGVALTGRVVYFTMGMPIVVTLVLVGRSLSLDNAARGVRLFWATWNGRQLARGQIWQTACGQVFFSTGIGFGYFTSYASYNQRHANAVMDAALIVASNVVFENVAAFAVYGVVGFLAMVPADGVRLGSFTVGFITLPSAVAQMPAANFWAVMLFLTLMVLGYSSAFAMVDAVVTLAMDAKPRWSRPLVVSLVVAVFFLLSLPYCTQFGYYLLDGIDRWTNDVALVFVVWAECVASTTVYRCRDVVAQVGRASFAAYNAGFLAAMVLGVALAHAVSPAVGAAVGLGLFVVAAAAASLTGKVPDAAVPRAWSRSLLTRRLWFLAFYSGNQLRRDLNQVVARGNNWALPAFWAPLIRYVSAPILAIVYSFSYPAFYRLREDPLHILGFAVGHVALVVVAAGFLFPRWLAPLIPASRRAEGRLDIGANVLLKAHGGGGGGDDDDDDDDDNTTHDGDVAPAARPGPLDKALDPESACLKAGPGAAGSRVAEL